MFGKILYISDNIAHVENKMNRDVVADLMNIHVIFEAPNQRILGEVIELNDDVIKIRFLGGYIPFIKYSSSFHALRLRYFGSLIRPLCSQ